MAVKNLVAVVEMIKKLIGHIMLLIIIINSGMVKVRGKWQIKRNILLIKMENVQYVNIREKYQKILRNLLLQLK